MMQGALTIFPVRGIGEVVPGDDLTALLLAALEAQQTPLQHGDVVIVTQKIVSKAEGRIVDPADVTPSHMAEMAAAEGNKDARHYELVLRESKRIIRMARGVLITETHHGLICANAGVDESNVDGGHRVTLLPVDPDASARHLRDAIRAQTGAEVAVIISDTFGRAWREGQVNVAIGLAGLLPLSDYASLPDVHGYTMRATLIAVADELASAAELVMNKVDQVPVAVVRGYAYTPAESSASALIRPAERDLFR